MNITINHFEPGQTQPYDTDFFENVSNVYYDSEYRRLQFNQDNGHRFSAAYTHHITIDVSEPTRSDLKVGDRITVIKAEFNLENKWIGQDGVITENDIDDNPPMYIVRFPDLHQSWAFFAWQLERKE